MALVVPVNSLPRRDGDLAQLLSLSGLCLLGVFVVTVAWETWPVQLLQPQWVLRLCGSLRGGASFPLVGAGLLLIGRYLDNGSKKAWNRITRQVRALAILASLGFLLLIPLQAYGLWGLAQAEDQQDRISIDRLTGITKAIAAANSEAALREAISGLPGAAGLASTPLQEPPGQVRQRLLAELTPQINQLQLKLGQRRRARLQRALVTGSRDSLICLLYAVPFAAIGKWPDRRYSFLSDLLDLLERIPELLSDLMAQLPRWLRLPMGR